MPLLVNIAEKKPDTAENGKVKVRTLKNEGCGTQFTLAHYESATRLGGWRIEFTCKFSLTRHRQNISFVHYG